jgi:hypothetical protein
MPLPRGRDSGRIAGNPEVIGSPVGLVPTNALALSGLANLGMSGKSGLILGSNLPGVADKSRRVGLSETGPLPDFPL